MRRLVKLVLPVLFALFALFAAGAHAQSTMNQGDMMHMMQAMQQCMARVDMDALERLGQEGEKVQAEVESLCKAGKRDAAQERAMEFGMRAAKDPNMKIMGECGQQMQGMMPKMPYTEVEGQKSRHVCDGM